MSYIHWLRAQVGARKIFLTFSSVIVCDAAGRVLLQRRADFDVWGLPGGCLERGEDIETCARRELLEETGLTVGALHLVGLYSEPALDVTYPNGDQVQQFTVCLHAQIAAGAPRADGEESLALQFFAPAEIPWDGLPRWYAHMLRDFFAGRVAAFGTPVALPETINQIADVRRSIGSACYIAPSATAVPRRADGKLLLIERADNGAWTFPAGYLDVGENAAYAAQREALEEAGIHVLPRRLLGVYSQPKIWEYPNGDLVQPVVAVFLCDVRDEIALPDGEETLNVRWMTPAEVLALPSDPILSEIRQLTVAHLDEGWFLR
ncbi:MAG: NUDIX domain-containing protein [Anaerolineales bacterium]